MKGLQNVTEATLEDLNNGEWDEKYSGKFLNYSLLEGEYVGLPTAEESWCFESFTVEELEALKEGIKDGSIVVDNTSTEADVSKFDYAKVVVNYVA